MDDGRFGPAVGGTAGADPASGEGEADASAAGRPPPDDAEAGEAGVPAEGGVHPGGRSGMSSAAARATGKGATPATVRRRSRSEDDSIGSGETASSRETSL